ncbi:MAG: thioesterase family protein [Chloroflexota bacterium]|jgi:acyl-CoA thioester hydrolase|nr:thioesterase family protein [Chloroflexota bacterium]MDP6509029.1 thioesterase family protein [Chloroflexota bacterium]MDP6758544.1 thioesterase family protein [Chloroflexota bacterium]
MTEGASGDGREPDHIERLRVRFSDTDAGGIAHHSNFFRWLEEARIGFLREIGLSYREIEKSGVHFPVTACTAEFLRTIRSEDKIEIDLWVARSNRVRMNVSYRVRLGSAVAAVATTGHAFVSDAGEPIRLMRDSALWQALTEFNPG